MSSETIKRALISLTARGRQELEMIFHPLKLVSLQSTLSSRLLSSSSAIHRLFSPSLLPTFELRGRERRSPRVVLVLDPFLATIPFHNSLLNWRNKVGRRERERDRIRLKNSFTYSLFYSVSLLIHRLQVDCESELRRKELSLHLFDCIKRNKRPKQCVTSSGNSNNNYLAVKRTSTGERERVKSELWSDLNTFKKWNKNFTHNYNYSQVPSTQLSNSRTSSSSYHLLKVALKLRSSSKDLY